MSDIAATGSKAKDVRLPAQERSSARIARVLAVTEEMLADIGPEKTSIPAVADASDVPRAAIYPFFPDKYALFGHLAQLHMDRVLEGLAQSRARHARTWRGWVRTAIWANVAYYNSHLAASVLLLGGSFADPTVKNVAIGRQLRAKAASLGQLLAMPTTPDAATIAVEITLACMRYGYALDNTISPDVRREAVRAATAYLAEWDR